jgi:hypothetical protein
VTLSCCHADTLSLFATHVCERVPNDHTPQDGGCMSRTIQPGLSLAPFHTPYHMNVVLKHALRLLLFKMARLYDC